MPTQLMSTLGGFGEGRQKLFKAVVTQISIACMKWLVRKFLNFMAVWIEINNLSVNDLYDLMVFALTIFTV